MLEDLIADRKKKLSHFIEAGINPYPAFVSAFTPINKVKESFTVWSEEKKDITIVGRITGMRGQGGVFFLDIFDGTDKLQIVVKKDTVEEHYALYQNNLDIGDFLESSGTLFVTAKGENSLLAKNLKLLVKSLRPLPSSYYGLENEELKLRERYLDILTDPFVRDLFIKKNIFFTSLRDHLKKHGFLEVETPVLESIAGGAEAEPFITHHNALDRNFYLRISLELPLKKLLVAGYPKVFELGRVFRNEGIDAEHLQDYTQCEFYWAYADYHALMDFTEDLYKKLVKDVTGGLTNEKDGHTLDWSKPLPRLNFCDLFEEKFGLDPRTAKEAELTKKAKEENIKLEGHEEAGRLIDLLYKKKIRPNLIQPCILMNPPVVIEPLAKRTEKDQAVVERFQIIAAGSELGKGFSELNDPLDQRTRFESQMELRKKGDKEAQELDEDFLTALEYGMPPAAGFGLSERLFAIIMDRPVRETVIFPLMKNKGTL
ncbi:MAG: lysine--tRNA ligase [Candidatus Harrisonbacteria bacterium]|nr:lysine--tRNA ligase [Candidatus Harrisonbacteria bacterium]